MNVNLDAESKSLLRFIVGRINVILDAESDPPERFSVGEVILRRNSMYPGTFIGIGERTHIVMYYGRCERACDLCS